MKVWNSPPPLVVQCYLRPLTLAYRHPIGHLEQLLGRFDSLNLKQNDFFSVRFDFNLNTKTH